MLKTDRKKKMEEHIAACRKEHNLTFMQAVVINRIDRKLKMYQKAVETVEDRRAKQIEKFQDINRAEIAKPLMKGE